MRNDKLRELLGDRQWEIGRTIWSHLSFSGNERKDYCCLGSVSLSESRLNSAALTRDFMELDKLHQIYEGKNLKRLAYRDFVIKKLIK